MEFKHLPSLQSPVNQQVNYQSPLWFRVRAFDVVKQRSSTPKLKHTPTLPGPTLALQPLPGAPSPAACRELSDRQSVFLKNYVCLHSPICPWEGWVLGLKCDMEACDPNNLVLDLVRLTRTTWVLSSLLT